MHARVEIIDMTEFKTGKVENTSSNIGPPPGTELLVQCSDH